MVLHDWVAEYDVIGRSVWRRLQLVLELFMVFTGTALVIDQETRKKCRKPHKSCSEN